MNQNLLEEIVKHILSNLGVIHSDFVDLEKSGSLNSNVYLLDKKISLEDDNKEIINRKIWGCEIVSEQKELKILLTDCWQDKDINEYYVIVQLRDAPAYGLFYTNNPSKYQENNSFIVCNVNNKGWMNCDTYLQATFLAGMEQLKNLGLLWGKCKNYDEQFNLLNSLISYHDSLFEEDNEGQEI